MTPTETVVSVHPGTPYKEIVRLLTEHRVSALPVLGDTGRVLGVVSEADLLPKESRSQLPLVEDCGRRSPNTQSVEPHGTGTAVWLD